jgi:sortase B
VQRSCNREGDDWSGNSWYLERNFDQVYTGPQTPGTIFADGRTPIISYHRPDNTTLYGHNMQAGTKFAYLIRYHAPHYLLTAYEKDPTVEFITIYDDENDVRNTYKIFAGILQNTQEEHGEVFWYFRQRHINSQGEFFGFIGDIMDRSTFYTDVDIRYGDEILTLSTCYYPLGRHIDSRFVVFARRVRPGEDPSVDVSKATINLDALYFDRWYRDRGGSWGGRKWDTSKVIGFDEFYNNNIGVS